ncbi:alpha/beta hydrolase [bacterium CPR1]|nr:alpha/beta hydrolase [bacterium CPR1]
MKLRHHLFHSKRTPGHWLKWVEAGSGPTIFFVHGCSGSWTNFTPQLADLSSEYHVVALDMRGHGSSPWPGPSQLADFETDLEEFVTEVLPGRFVLVLHSFGGCVGARLAASMPDRTAAVAFLNTAGSIPQGPTYRLLQLMSSRAHLLSESMPNLVSTNSEVSQHMLYYTLKEWDVWDCYPKIEVPSLVVLGALDPLIPVTSGLRMAQLLPEQELTVFPLGGHVAMWEQPRRLNAMLRALARRVLLSRVA